MPGAGKDLPRGGEPDRDATGAGQLEEIGEVPDQPPVPDEADDALVEDLAALRGGAAVGAVPGKEALAVGEVCRVQPELDGEVTPDGAHAEHAARGTAQGRRPACRR